MATTLTEAKTYISDEQTIAKLFKQNGLTGDLIKPFKGKGNGTVSVQTVTLGASTAGTYSKATGYTAMDITSEWKDYKPAHDDGNQLSVDRLEDEAALGDSLVKAFNRYERLIIAPTCDKDNLAAIVGYDGVTTKTETAASSATTIQARLDAGIDSMVTKGLSTSAPVVCYISVSQARNLKTSLKNIGGIKLGEWNGVVDAQVAIYGDSIKAKIVEIPDNLMPSKTEFIFVPVDAADAVLANFESVYYDHVPGHGSRKVGLDVGFLHDCFVNEEGKALIYVGKVQ